MIYSNMRYNTRKTTAFRPILILRENLLLISAILLPIFPTGDIFSLIILMIMMFRKRIPDAMLGIILVALSNPAIFSNDVFSFGRWIILFLFIIISVFNFRSRSVGIDYAILSLAVYMFWGSFFVSSIPALSFFKATAFIFTLWLLINGRQFSWLKFSKRMDGFIPIYILSSVPLILVPQIGKQLNGLGFQGFTNQPQTFGVLCAGFAVWLYSRVWSGTVTVSHWVIWASLAGLLYLIIESQARIALISAFVGLILVYLIHVATNLKQIARALSLGIIVFTSCSLIYTQTSIVQNFINKERIGGVRENSSVNSRAVLIDRSLQNYTRSPIIGIGFGIPSSFDSVLLIYDPIFRTTIGANSEKGVWLSAVLEELGVAGFLIFMALIFSLFLYAGYVKSYMSMAMLVYMLTSNLGEMTMFSMGAFGLIQWLLFFSLLFGNRKLENPL